MANNLCRLKGKVLKELDDVETVPLPILRQTVNNKTSLKSIFNLPFLFSLHLIHNTNLFDLQNPIYDTGTSNLAQKWARLARNWTNLELIHII